MSRVYTMGTEAPHRRSAKDVVLWSAYLGVFALAVVTCVAAFDFLKADPQPGQQASAAGAASTAVASERASQEPPAAIYEDKGRLPLVRRVAIPEAELSREVVPEPAVHVSFGASATVKFALRDGSGRPVHIANPSASAFHGNDVPIALAVVDAGDGQYDVQFAPGAPGRFDIVLDDSGRPVATKRVGVVGVAGAPGDDTDADFLSVDPRSPRMRTSGRSSLR